MFIEIRKIKRLQKDGTHTCHAKQWPTPPSICKVSPTECNECSWHHVTHAITSHRMKTCILLQTPHTGSLLTPICTTHVLCILWSTYSLFASMMSFPKL